MKNKINLLLAIIMFALLHASGYSQNKQVTGAVTDPAKLSIPGVNILVKGTNRGTSTDFDGQYKISASPGETLVFSFVGFVSKEVKIGVSNS